MTQTGTFELDFLSEALAKFLPFRKDSPPIYIPIRFVEAFDFVPKVVLGISGFHGGGDAFHFKLQPVRITESSFEVMLIANRNWIDSIQVSWLATDT